MQGFWFVFFSKYEVRGYSFSFNSLVSCSVKQIDLKSSQVVGIANCFHMSFFSKNCTNLDQFLKFLYGNFCMFFCYRF